MFDMLLFLMILSASTNKFCILVCWRYCVVKRLPRYDESDRHYMRRKDAHQQFRERHLFIHDSTFSKLVGSRIECVYVVSSNIFLCRYLTNIE